MHRMVLALSMLLVGTHAQAQSQQSAASSTKAASLPTDELSDDLGETPESIAALPWIVGDRESTRREWIKKAYDLRADKSADKTAGDEASRKHQIDEYLRAADSIRSSTFTRCNLGLLAHERGDVVSSAEYFRRETSQPLREGATSREKFIRHVCETYAALAKQRVGELNIKAPEHSTVWINHHYVGAAPLLGTVFVKPNEEQNVKVKLSDRSELRETIALRPGESTTLEFYSPPAPKSERSGEPKQPPLPVAKEEDRRWEYVGMASGAVGAAGVVLMGVGVVKLLSLPDGWQRAWETTAPNGKDSCPELWGAEGCGNIIESYATAQTLSISGLSLVGVGLTGGLISYILKPNAKVSTLSLALSPNSAHIHGTF